MHMWGRRNEREQSNSGENWMELGRAMETSLVSIQTVISCGWRGDRINTQLLFESHRYEIWTWVRALQLEREVLTRALFLYTSTTSGARRPSSLSARSRSELKGSGFCFFREANKHLVMCSFFAKCLEYQAMWKTLTLKERVHGRHPNNLFCVCHRVVQFRQPNLNMSETWDRNMCG